MATTTSTADIVIRARDHASAKLGLIGRSAGQMTSMLRTAALGVTGYLSTRAIIGFAKSSVDAFAEDQQAVTKLSASLRLLNKAAEIGRHKAFASQIQRLTTVGDEATLSMMAMGSSVGNLSGDALQRATVAAIGLSKAYSIDLQSAMRLVARAAVGDTATLKRYGIVLSEGADASGKFNQLMTLGAQKFQIARAETTTFSGRVQQLANAWGDAKERLGQYIAEHQRVDTAFQMTTMAISNLDKTMAFVFSSMKLQVVDLAEAIKYHFSAALPFDPARPIPENKGKLLLEILKKISPVGRIEHAKDLYGMAVKGEEFSVHKLFGFGGVVKALRGEEKAGPRADSPYLARLRAETASASEALARAFEAYMEPYRAASTPASLSSLLALSGGRTREGVAAVESRFLTGTGRPLNDYQQQIAQLTRRQIAILEKIAAGIERQQQAGQRMMAPVLAAAMFA